MERQIFSNLNFLTNHIKALEDVLDELQQKDLICPEECDQIKSKNTTAERNSLLLYTLGRKDWHRVGNDFLEILKKTGNRQCADKIEQTALNPSRNHKHPEISKWWPDKQHLIKSIYKRKHKEGMTESGTLVDELDEQFSKSSSRIVVICESADASTYSGMGGIGKTLTAKWYANDYEELYDHIIWMDAREGSLLQSFKKLSSDVKINELTTDEEFVWKSYKVLSEFRCLWIFDNLENPYYCTKGAMNFFPKNCDNFYFLITSRKSSEIKRYLGDSISEFQLGIFRKEESLDFSKLNLNDTKYHQKYILEQLCLLSYNLPLALQLITGALNNGKINSQDYRKKAGEKKDDTLPNYYQRHVSNLVKISLDLISKEKHGESANQILMTLAYTRAGDINSLFLLENFRIHSNLIDYFKSKFSNIFTSNMTNLRKGIDLLIKYSMISVTKWSTECPYNRGWLNELRGRNKKQVEMDWVNIHPLLQEVIRHNGREKERATLWKIFGSHGFIDYKINPFSKFANQELRKIFPKVESNLLQSENLQRLLKEGQLEDAVQLSKFIHEELKTDVTKFNYATCLSIYGELLESSKHLDELYERKLNVKSVEDFHGELGILKTNAELTQDLIGGHLLIILWKMENLTRIQEILVKRQSFEFLYSAETLDTLMQILTSGALYCKFSVTKGSCNSSIKLHLEENKESDTMELKDCTLAVSYFSKLSMEKLCLDTVSMTQDGEKLENITFNNILDFEKIKYLKLSFEEEMKENMKIDLCDDVDMEYLQLRNMQVLNWADARWDIGVLELHYIPFLEKTNLKIKKLEIRGEEVDLSCLPQNIQRLHLDSIMIGANNAVELLQLKYLTLEMTDASSLTHFQASPLQHVYFDRCTGVNANEQLWNVLGQFHTENIVIYDDTISPFELEALMNRNSFKRKKIFLGIVKWGQEDIVSDSLDQKAEYYFFENGKGQAINKLRFDELLRNYFPSSTSL